ncbi:unnamed protein product [Brassicogethes aeneus]|uniref:Uncharacterized protein n=1 Tax=Brassicogethes aeneus TaxID=1431903 RepID=A0A9P0FB46_BRAAE|nr:unnamed protein product [Brassicogethes aeneus]
MAEGTYEYECMRAELLGVDKPDYEEFLKKQEENEKNKVEEEEQDLQALQDADSQNDNLKNISGGLEELNGILAVTQRKINRFKASCGSLTNLLKIKMGGAHLANSTNDVSVDPTSSSNVENPVGTGSNVTANGDRPTNDEVRENGTHRKSDLTKALDNHVDRLDLMLEKAENAQYSMKHQNNQMKRFLN